MRRYRIAEGAGQRPGVPHLSPASTHRSLRDEFFYIIIIIIIFSFLQLCASPCSELLVSLGVGMAGGVTWRVLLREVTLALFH